MRQRPLAKLTLRVPETKIANFANSVDPDEAAPDEAAHDAAQHELPYPDQHYLPSSL